MASIHSTPTTFEIRAYAGRDPVTGKSRNLYRSLPADAHEDEVRYAAEKLQADADMLKGKGVPFTVEGLVSFYIDSMESDHSPTYIDGLRSNARCYIYPFLGSRPAGSVRPYEFARLYQRLLADGGKDGQPVSTSTVRKLHAWLKPAFSQLVQMGLLGANPLEGVKRPKPCAGEVTPLTEPDLAALTEYLVPRCDTHRPGYNPLDCALWLDLNTGLRASELAGLQLRDVSSTRRELAVRRCVVRVKGKGLAYKPPKSAAGVRKVSLSDAVLQPVVDLVKLRRQQTTDHATAPLFAKPGGGMCEGDDISRRFRQVRELLELDKGYHLHTLRHTHATYLLESGVPMRTVQERLGHSNIGITLGTYGHVLPGSDAEAAAKFDDVLESI